jgi:hypothetical protein
MRRIEQSAEQESWPQQEPPTPAAVSDDDGPQGAELQVGLEPQSVAAAGGHFGAAGWNFD